MELNIVVLDGYTLNPGDLSWEGLSNLGKLKVFPRSSAREGVERGRNADILVVNKFVLDRSNLSEFPNLKYIVISATGHNNVDISLAASLNIPVSNVTGYSASSVAQHVFAVLLAYLHTPDVYHRELAEGKWSRCPDFSYWNHTILELKGKLFGIYGFGAIGQKVAEIAKAFGMSVIVHTRTPGKDEKHLKFVSLQTLFTSSDILSLHAPQTDENLEFVNQDMLECMKKTSILINTARGKLIHENDLYNALKNGGIKAAFLDVLSTEPPPVDHPLLRLSNCHLTPHLAWASLESRQRLMDGVIENIRAFKNGENINQLN